MNTLLTKLLSFVTLPFHVLFPELCPYCQKEFLTDKKPLCSSCMEKLKYARLHTGQLCSVCGQPLDKHKHCSWCAQREIFFHKHFSLSDYHSQAKKILQLAKFQNRKNSLAYIRQKSQEQIDKIIASEKIVHLVYLPSSKKLVTSLRNSKTKASGNKILRHQNVFYKAKNQQSKKLNRLHRFRAIEASLQIHKEEAAKLASGNVLVIDDVWTTGATVNRACKLLVDQGIGKENLYVFTVMQRSEYKHTQILSLPQKPAETMSEKNNSQHNEENNAKNSPSKDNNENENSTSDSHHAAA